MKEYIVKFEYIKKDRIKIKADTAQEVRDKIRQMGQDKEYTHYSIQSILLQGDNDES